MRTAALAILLVVLSLFVPRVADAKERTHVVASGHTLGKISKRYHVSIDEICKANHISRRDPLKLGQKLIIPDQKGAKSSDDADKDDDDAADKDDDTSSDSSSDDDDADAKEEPAKAKTEDKPAEPSVRRYGSDGMRVLDVPGHGEAYFYEPIGRGRKSLRPVVMYLHGRGGHPAHDCRRWASVARRFGWLVCPSGPGTHGDGRDWANNWAAGQRVAVATVQALRKKFGRRVQLYGNTLIGFSEGAYVAQNVGVREPRTFNRWLILAGKTTYFGGPGMEELKKNSRRVKRIYLITGEQDDAVDGTRTLKDWLENAKIAVHISTPKDMGHEVALERKAGMYSAALAWLDRGVGQTPKASAAKSKKSSRKR